MVVSLSNVSPGQGSSYYTKEGYYWEDEQRSHSQWNGQLCSLLGVSGPVNAQDFSLLLQGKNLSGEVLIDKSRLHKRQENSKAEGRSVPVERAGTDLTSSAPKSVSIQALIFGDRNLELAHRQAIEQMLQVVEARCAVTRITQDKKRLRLLTGKVAIAQFHHDTSRALDPQLHTHNILLNLQQRPDGKWQSLDNRAIYQAKMLLGLIYRNELAVVVQQLGYPIGITNRKHGFWELKGYEQALLEKFSKRAIQIREAASEDASSRRKAWVASHSHRAKKQLIGRDELLARWQAEAKAVGIEPIEPGHPQTFSPDVAQILVRDGIAYLAQHLTPFEKEDLERYVLTHVGQVSFEALQDAMVQDRPLWAIAPCLDPKLLTQPPAFTPSPNEDNSNEQHPSGLEISPTIRDDSTADSGEAGTRSPRYLPETESRFTAASGETNFGDSIQTPYSSRAEAGSQSDLFSFGERVEWLDAASPRDSGAGGSAFGPAQTPTSQPDYPQADAGSGGEEDRADRYLLHQLTDEFAELERVFAGESSPETWSTVDFPTADRDQPQAADDPSGADQNATARSDEYDHPIQDFPDLDENWEPSL